MRRLTVRGGRRSRGTCPPCAAAGGAGSRHLQGDALGPPRQCSAGGTVSCLGDRRQTAALMGLSVVLRALVGGSTLVAGASSA